jgi:thioredoxin 1
MSPVIHTNDLSFDQDVVNSELPVLVEFGAQWCGPCKKQLPILEEFAESNKDNVKVMSLDIDESPATTGEFSVRGVPTLMLFKGGKKVGVKVGLTTKAGLEKLLSENL